ncbi:hypothetical protein FQA47_022538 [Oryzias melastigma]|uniref:Uncharacterized protein n=1 Tax=Oryzias melastigma TaxID=30732 RepID=A0A834CJ56_ORYME|nr:hypothetical protein FQA47_022538 [Oryzias melastigma]
MGFLRSSQPPGGDKLSSGGFHKNFRLPHVNSVGSVGYVRLKVTAGCSLSEAVPAEAEGPAYLQEHAEDDPTGARRGRQEVPEGLGPRGVQEEQGGHEPGRDPHDDHSGQEPSGGAAEVLSAGSKLTSEEGSGRRPERVRADRLDREPR